MSEVDKSTDQACEVHVSVSAPDGTTIDDLLLTMASEDTNAEEGRLRQGHPVNAALTASGHKNLDLIEKFRKFLRLILNAPDLVEMLIFSGWLEQGVVTKKEAVTYHQITERLIGTLRRGRDGEKMAKLQIEAMHRILQPEYWNLGEGDIQSVADLDKSGYGLKHGLGVASLARGFELYRIMGKLSRMVEPRKSSDALTPATPVRPSSRASATRRSGYDKVKGLVSTNTTLQALAIKIYLDDLKREGKNTEAETLRNDLKIVKNWQTETSPTPHTPGITWVTMIGGPDLPVIELAHGWKTRPNRRKDYL